MILLDAFALVALLADESAADEVDGLLRDEACALGVVNLAEVADVSARVRDIAPERVHTAVDLLVGTGALRLVEATAEVAWRAAALRLAHYAKKTCEVSLADCFLLATAGIATADPGVAAVARATGLKLIALPDSSGRRP